jgi:fructokinase
VGGIEAGGSKFVCAIGTGPGDVRVEARVPTTTPGETLPRVIEFFRAHAAAAPLAALGIAAFGPVDLDPGSPAFGRLQATPKPGWAGADLAGPLRDALGVAVAVETDVNAAALAEHRWGAARDVDTLAYVTVGTGVGGGAIVRGQPLHGLLHPEMGHIPLPAEPGDAFAGACPHHGRCLEGLASGRALAERWGAPPETLPPDHPAWALEARYLGAGLAAIACILSPERIVVGGGVLRQAHLLPRIRAALGAALAGYLPVDALAGGLDAYVVAPGLGEQAGALGAIALARDAAGGGCLSAASSPGSRRRARCP